MRLLSLLAILALCTTFAFTVEAPTTPDKPTATAETPAKSTATTPAEAKLGAKVAEQIEKEMKLVKDEKQLERLKVIAADLVPHSERPDVVYTCKILDSGELNAMAIPGGTIYVTSGLLAAVESDHELAGVIAHEIAHNAMYHTEKSVRKDTRITIGQIALILATMSMDKDRDIPTEELLIMSQLVKQSLMNGYSVDLEFEADHQAITYLHKSKKYDPVGLYSVILGFLQIEARKPVRELGYLKTHPKPAERKAALTAQLTELKVPINIWRVVNFRAKANEPAHGATGYGLQLGDVPLITLHATVGDQDAKARATKAAEAINRRLVTVEVDPLDVDVDIHDGTAAIRMRRVAVLTLTQADADAAGMTLDALSTGVVRSIREAFQFERIKRS